MADNWLTFSEVIPNLTAAEEEWLEHQLEGIAIVGGKEYPYELGDDDIKAGREQVAVEKAEFAGCRPTETWRITISACMAARSDFNTRSMTITISPRAGAGTCGSTLTRMARLNWWPIWSKNSCASFGPRVAGR